MIKSPSVTRRKTSLRGRPSTRDPIDAGNRTILIGVKLLQAVAQMREPATLTEISQRTEMSVSRAYRYLTSLAQTGFLQQDPATGKYDLGPAAIELGIAAMGRVDAIRLASDAMRELTEETRLVSILSVWGSNGPTVIKWEQGQLDLAVRIREGLNLPVPITAAGRLFLTYLPERELRPLLDRDVRAWNAQAPARQKLTEKSLGSLRAEVRRHGLGRAIGLRTPHTAALAAPVFDGSGRLSMTISILGVAGSFDTDYDGPPARALKAAAERLTRTLGGVAPKA
ncbi:MAG: IclR family transcriptional regulator [Gemmatimonas sp.]